MTPGARRPAVIAVAALVVTVVACSGTGRSAGSPSTSDGCDPPAGPPWDEFGSIHTIVAPANSNDVEVTVEPAQAVCPSGVVQMRITVTNLSGSTQAVDTGRGLLLSGGMNKYPLAMVSSVDLAPGEVTTFVVTVQLPLAPPARYWVGIEGYGPGGEIVLLDPATQ